MSQNKFTLNPFLYFLFRLWVPAYAAIILIFIFMCMAGPVNAIGMMTKPIVVDNVRRGQVISEELRVLNNEQTQAKFELLASGDIKEWTKFYWENEEVEEVELAAQTRKRVQVKITAPEDIPNGKYQGQLKIKYSPALKEKKEQTYAQVAQQISRDVTLKVTDQEILDLSASVSPRSYSLDPGQPLNINAFYYNRGNISLQPDLRVKITRNGDTLHHFIYPYPEEEEPVRPLSEKKITVSYTPGETAPGKYSAQTAVYANGEMIQEDKFTFEITAESTRENNNGEDSLFLIIASAAGGIFLLLVAGAYSSKKLIKNNKSNV